MEEQEVREFLLEIFRKFKKDYPLLNPKSFIVSLANMYGEMIPENHLSKSKYNIMLDLLKTMYGR